MSIWFKKLIQKFTGVVPASYAEPTEIVDCLNPEPPGYGEPACIDPTPVEFTNDSFLDQDFEESRLTFDQLMVLTKKEQIAYAEGKGIEVKAHWTKKNIAKEIVINL